MAAADYLDDIDYSKEYFKTFRGWCHDCGQKCDVQYPVSHPGGFAIGGKRTCVSCGGVNVIEGRTRLVDYLIARLEELSHHVDWDQFFAKNSDTAPPECMALWKQLAQTHNEGEEIAAANGKP